MGVQKIKKLFEQGRYEEALQTVEKLAKEQQLLGLSYKALILCLKGELLEADPLVDHLTQLSRFHDDQSALFRALAIKTYLRAYQGKEQEMFQLFNEGQELLTSLEERERIQLKEWEGWLHHGIAWFLMSHLRSREEIIPHLNSSLEIFESLQNQGGREWLLRLTIWIYCCYNEHKIASDYLEQLKI
jgi:tetratricopeptide (TPR) repeat protein